MSYDVTTQPDGKRLRVQVEGDRSRGDLVAEATRAWRKIAADCADAGCNQILVVTAATGSFPTLDAYIINSILNEYGVQRTWSIAFVSLDTESYRDVEFAETVIVNRGFDAKVFRTEGEALDWLKAL